MSDAATGRALRKRLLLMRAATERAEMAEALGAARQAVAFPKIAVSGLAVFKGLPLALSLLKRLPLIRPALSLVLSGARRPVLRYALVAGGAGFLAWKGYQWFMHRNALPTEGPGEAGQTEG